MICIPTKIRFSSQENVNSSTFFTFICILEKTTLFWDFKIDQTTECQIIVRPPLILESLSNKIKSSKCRKISVGRIKGHPNHLKIICNTNATTSQKTNKWETDS